MVNIYTDGACSGNQNSENVGGWGAILEKGAHTKSLCGGNSNTTNNKMELTAVKKGLEALTRHNIHVNLYSDSAYIINCLTDKWYKKWIANGWKTSQKKPVENQILWMDIITLIEKLSSISFYKVKGHLDVNKTTEVNKWRGKFEKAYGPISEEKFFHLIKMNHQVDGLANEGMAPFFKKTVPSEGDE